jgi:hypothetical protein
MRGTLFARQLSKVRKAWLEEEFQLRTVLIYNYLRFNNIILITDIKIGGHFVSIYVASGRYWRLDESAGQRDRDADGLRLPRQCQHFHLDGLNNLYTPSQTFWPTSSPTIPRLLFRLKVRFFPDKNACAATWLDLSDRIADPVQLETLPICDGV